MTPEEILNEMQILTDVEADLADTALAVTASTSAELLAPDPSTLDPIPDHAEALLDVAEQVEAILEESIPDAHSQSLPDSSSTSEMILEPESNSIEPSGIPGFGESRALPVADAAPLDSDKASILVDHFRSESQSHGTDNVLASGPDKELTSASSVLAAIAADIDQPILSERIELDESAISDSKSNDLDNISGSKANEMDTISGSKPNDLDTISGSKPETNDLDTSDSKPNDLDTTLDSKSNDLDTISGSKPETNDLDVSMSIDEPSAPSVPSTEPSAPTTEASPPSTEPSAPIPIVTHLLPTEPNDLASNPSTPRNEHFPIDPKPVTVPHERTTSTSTAGPLKPLTPLPEGITLSSASAVAHPELIRAYQEDPSDTHIALSLFEWSIGHTEITDARAWYSIIAADSPTATRPLLSLVNLELALSNFVQVERLFATALRGPSGNATASADANVWKAYLHYIRRQHLVTEDAPNYDQVRSTVSAAYEYALRECGFDRESGDIWQEYIAYLSEAKPKNTWDVQKQMDEIRKTYQNAVCIPLNNVEALWKAYDAFESGLNKLTAKKFLAEKSPAYMTARTALRDLRNLTDKLPIPTLPPHPNFSDEDRRIVASWKAYLKWEESNPLVIGDEQTLESRVGYALRKCLGQMRHFPELWHWAAHYFGKQGKLDDAVSYLQAGIQACPKSFLLTFALADLEESRSNFKVAHEAYESLLNNLSSDLDSLKKAVTLEVENARGPALADNNQDDEQVSRLVEERENRGRSVAERRGKDVEDLQGNASVVWIMYMRFARRAEGIKSARLIFGRARKSPHVTWHSYEASAMMEYHSNKEAPVAIRIFELGLKSFSEETHYVISYLQFLLSINDDTNARALFERSALKIPVEKARPLWDAWARYEYMYGDLAAVQKLESRFTETFPNDPPLKRFAQRFIYNGIDAIAQRDLGFRSAPTPAPSQSTNNASQVHTQAMPLHKQNSTPPPQQSQHYANSPLKREYVDHRDRSPDGGSYKRPRPTSPPPARRAHGGGQGNPGYKERSPLPPQGGVIPRHQERVSLPPPNIPSRDQIDRSGLTAPLANFIARLPTTRSFEACAGPIFRPDDIMGLFSSISREGTGAAPPRVAYAEPERYRAPPPVRGRGY